MHEAAASLAAFNAPGTVFFIDGLAYGALPVSALEALKGPIVALVHHPLGLEEGLTPSEKAHLLKTEDEALSLARHVVVPSHGTARELMRLFSVPAGKITVAEPGILRGIRAPGALPGQPLHIVSVGGLAPRKGYGVLIDALNEVRDRPGEPRSQDPWTGRPKPPHLSGKNYPNTVRGKGAATRSAQRGDIIGTL